VNAFHVIGGLLAIWAVIVTALGLSNHDFPGNKERLVTGISIVMVIAAIAAGIITSAAEEEEEEPEEAAAALVR
jgi:hypothetical protein